MKDALRKEFGQARKQRSTPRAVQQASVAELHSKHDQESVVESKTPDAHEKQNKRAPLELKNASHEKQNKRAREESNEEWHEKQNERVTTELKNRMEQKLFSVSF